MASVDLVAMEDWSEEELEARFGDTPIKRAQRQGFLRNVAVAFGNWGSEEAVPALKKLLADPEPLVRGHAAWALGRIGSREARCSRRSPGSRRSSRYCGRDPAGLGLNIGNSNLGSEA